MMNKLITAAALALALTAPAIAQTTVKVGADLEINRDNRPAIRAEVYQPVGPVVLGVSTLSRYANEGAAGANEIAVSVGYTIPYSLFAVTPFVKGEVGAKTVSSKKDNFFGIETGVGGPVVENVTWSASYRHRNFNSQTSENRYTVGVAQKLDESTVVEYSVYRENYNESKNKNIIAAGVSLAKTF